MKQTKNGGIKIEFTFRTEYDPSAVAAMAKALRKTVRKNRSNRAMILGIFVVVLAILFSIPSQNETFVLSGRLIITWLAAAAVIIVMIWQDQINGLLAQKRMLPGTNVSETVFSESEYTSLTQTGKTTWGYGSIQSIAQTDRYFIFLYSQNHANVYDKRSISGGTPEEFSAFIQEKTGLTIHNI